MRLRVVLKAWWMRNSSCASSSVDGSHSRDVKALNIAAFSGVVVDGLLLLFHMVGMRANIGYAKIQRLKETGSQLLNVDCSRRCFSLTSAKARRAKRRVNMFVTRDAGISLCGLRVIEGGLRTLTIIAWREPSFSVFPVFPRRDVEPLQLCS